MTGLTQKIRSLLEENNIPYKEVDHKEANTCEASAQARGEEIKIGGKTLLYKSKKGFCLFVLSALYKADNNKIRKILKSQKLRFATSEELKALVGVPKGAIPPFGRDILPFDLYLDLSIIENDKIAFNAGLLTKSFIISTNDYLKLVTPNICLFSIKPE